MIRVNRKEAKLLDNAIKTWLNDAVIDDNKAEELKKSISPYRNEYDSLAFYASIAAVSCALMAFGALVLDEKWIEKLRKFFAFSEFVIGFLFMAFSVLLIWFAKRRNQKYAFTAFANDSFTVLIALTIGVSIAYFARGFHITYQYYGGPIFIAAVIYGALALYLNSKLLWACMLLAIISAWGAQTYTWSVDAKNSYFLGMNYPLRMFALGGIFIALTWVLRKRIFFSWYYRFTWYFSWIFFLLSGLFVSVSGNWDYIVWSDLKQSKLFIWALLYTILLIIVLVYAVKNKDETLRDIAIVFFLLNIYTRYFEYFWDRTNKGVFFALLALSFWLIGKKAEQLRKRVQQL